MKAVWVGKALTALILSATVFIAHAAPVLVFYNSNFVNTGGTPEDESDTLQAALIATGNPVTTFTATDANGISTALAGQTVLVIPEQEAGALASALDEAARNVIRNLFWAVAA